MSSDSSWTTRLSSFEVGAREHGRAMHEFIHKKFSKGQGSGSSEGEAAGRFCFLEVIPDLIVQPLWRWSGRVLIVRHFVLKHWTVCNKLRGPPAYSITLL